MLAEVSCRWSIGTMSGALPLSPPWSIASPCRPSKPGVLLWRRSPDDRVIVDTSVSILCRRLGLGSLFGLLSLFNLLGLLVLLCLFMHGLEHGPCQGPNFVLGRKDLVILVRNGHEKFPKILDSQVEVAGKGYGERIAREPLGFEDGSVRLLDEASSRLDDEFAQILLVALQGLLGLLDGMDAGPLVTCIAKRGKFILHVVRHGVVEVLLHLSHLGLEALDELPSLVDRLGQTLAIALVSAVFEVPEFGNLAGVRGPDKVKLPLGTVFLREFGPVDGALLFVALAGKVHEHVTAPHLVRGQALVQEAGVVGIEPSLGILQCIVLEAVLSQAELQGALFGEGQMLERTVVPVGQDGGEELDGPPVDPDEEDAVVEAVPVVGVQEVDMIELWRWEEDVERWHLGIGERRTTTTSDAGKPAS